MNLLGLVLVGEGVTGSLSSGAQLAGIATLAAGAAAPLRGRALDRTELRTGLRRDLLASAAATGAIVAAVLAGAPWLVLAVLAGVLGLVSAAVIGAFRTLMVAAVEPHQLEPATAVDAVLVEVGFVAGPAVAGVAALVVGPVGVLVLQATSFLVAATLLGHLPRRPPVDASGRTGRAPWRTRGATSIYLLTFGVGFALGALEATLPARAEDLGLDPAVAGPLLALTALGSGAAGVYAATLTDPLRRGRVTAGALLIAMGAAVVPAALAPNVVGLGVALVVVGAPFAPMNAIASMTLQRTVHHSRRAEGFSLFAAMILVGAGTGQATAGLLLEHLTPSEVMAGLAAVPVALGLVVLQRAAHRRAAGLTLGLGHRHDPAIADPMG